MKKKNSNPVGALKRTGAYMNSSMGIIIFALVLAALSAVMTIIGPDKIGKMATIMSDGLFTGIDLTAIAKIGVFLAIIYCLSALFGFIQHYIMAVVTLKMSYRMRGELSEKINRVPQKYFNTTSQGDILSRITNDVSTLQQGLTNSLPTIISAATQFVGCLIMMFVTEWRMALVALCITLLGMVLIVAIMSAGHFTSSGHFIVLRGVKDEKILVADPVSRTRSEQSWDLSIILNEASKAAGSGGPFWIIG